MEEANIIEELLHFMHIVALMLLMVKETHVAVTIILPKLPQSEKPFSCGELEIKL